MGEVWKNLSEISIYKDYDKYEVSNFGNLRSLDARYPSGKVKKGKDKKIRINDKGYSITTLSLNNKSKTVRVHRLVALAFIENLYNKPEVNHIDGNKQNNRVDNLEWATRQEDINHSVKNGLSVKGEDIHNSKLKVADVVEIRELYSKLGNKFNYKHISNKYNVGLATIYDVVSRRTWKDVK